MFAFHTMVLLSFWSSSLFGYAHPLERRHAPAIEDTFNLYAYGESISGLPVYYADGKAEIGDWKLSTAKVAYPIYFTATSSSSSTWVAHANTSGTGLGAGSFDEAVLSLPSVDSSGGTVLFKPKTASSATSASIFHVYGNYVLVDTEHANFYAVPTEVAGVYSLIWSAVGSDQIGITLRTIAPATDTLLL
ncbi:hypothetical protein BJY01DRAFT_241838 [Aspergillus pseudoustus]|uniref:Uncharacterized protein n=1 Tax=Aspergillus pseudoustus TaxID=1810923 RepID=A0ABR4L2X0_9EURO